jgi:hypothetical protein
MLTVVELAEASVANDRATTSDKRKRRLNTMDPPKTIRIRLLSFLTNFPGGEDATYKCNRDANGRARLCSLLQALADCGNGKVKEVADVLVTGWKSIGVW